MRAVIKIGSATLTDSSGRIDKEQVGKIVSQIAEAARDNEIIVVSSGAVASGMGDLGIGKRPRVVSELQALAAVGQNVLMHHYHEEFSKCGVKIAQVLVSEEDFSVRERYLNMRNTLTTLIAKGIIPIINENDVVATEELKVGDNDRLSAIIAANLEADLLLMLSSVPGLYDRDPRRFKKVSLIEKVEMITPEIERRAGKAQGLGVGGFRTKIEAAKICSSAGVKMIIAHGKREEVIIDGLAGRSIGTVFLPRERRNGRKLWIGTSKPKGIIYVDDGAKKALLNGKSLLPSGVKAVKGVFNVGDIVEIQGIGKGIADYSSSDIDRIKGKKSGDIWSVLGYSSYDAVVRRENMVLE